MNPSKALSILVGSIPRSLGTTALLVGSWISLNDGVRVYCFFFPNFHKMFGCSGNANNNNLKRNSKRKESVIQTDTSLIEATKNLDVI